MIYLLNNNLFDTFCIDFFKFDSNSINKNFKKSQHSPKIENYLK